MFRTSYRKSLPALILHILVSFVNSKTIRKLGSTNNFHVTETNLEVLKSRERVHGHRVDA